MMPRAILLMAPVYAVQVGLVKIAANELARTVCTVPIVRRWVATSRTAILENFHSH